MPTIGNSPSRPCRYDSHQRASTIPGAVQAKGLVERRAVASDRRLAHVTLTDNGRALHARMLPRVAAVNGAILARLSNDEVAALDGLLGALQRQATELLAASAWPKADRRRGGRKPG